MSLVKQDRASKLQDRFNSFNETILDLLEHVEYRLVTGGEDLEAIYRLRYESFLKAGMLDPKPIRMLEDRWDDLPNSYRFAVYIDGDLAGTLRVNHVTRDMPYAPAMDTFPELLVSRVERGETFIDLTRFAADPDKAPVPGVLPFITLRLAMMANHYFKPTSALAAIKEDHAAFYRRVFDGFKIGGPTPYPGLVVPRYLYEVRCGEYLNKTIERFPFFRSSPVEQRMLFGSLPADRDPLTVLPTAKYMCRAA
ncbi:MAG: hypothetical protein AB7P20_02375 [Rhizobiaceae bacterium]